MKTKFTKLDYVFCLFLIFCLIANIFKIQLNQSYYYFAFIAIFYYGIKELKIILNLTINNKND